MVYHKPVLLHESVDGLNIKPEGNYVDLTFGGGGHSREVLKKLGKNGRLIAFDQDQDAEANVPDDGRVIFVGANFRYLRNYLRYYSMDKVDGILADLGISSHQIDRPDRGFSFKSDAELDMRMDRRGGISARQLVNTYDFEGLVRIFRAYGELKNASALANAIIQARQEAALTTTVDLERALLRFIPKAQPSKFMAKVYQALRIEVNAEMDRAGGTITAQDREASLDALRSMDEVLGLLELAREARAVDDTTEAWIEEQVELREEARRNRDFAEADTIRDALADKGVVLEDSPDGTRWKVVK